MDIEGNGHHLLKISWNLIGRPEEKNLRTGSVLAETHPKHFLNTSLQHYC
jgi:hypothetical protein